jgi:hypothetical protein
MTDLEGRVFVVKGRTLVPADHMADELMSGLKNGAEVIVRVNTPRHPEYHRFFMSFCQLVVDNTDGVYTDLDHFLFVLKVELGHVRRFIHPQTGLVLIETKSISFASMSEDQFRRFANRALWWVEKTHGIARKPLMLEVQATQSPRQRQREVA